MKEGLSGNIAKAFINSKITILLMIAFLLMGAYSTFLIPREEEPQIDVPIADIFIGYPGANPKEVETKLVAPLEKIVSNVDGVEYVYSTSMEGQAMLIVQFFVGKNVEHSMVKLYNEILKNMNQMPVGITQPLIKTRAIDDVPVLGLTLWSNSKSDYELKQISETVSNELKKVKDVAAINIIGGRSKEIKVELDKNKMAEYGVDLLTIKPFIEGNNVQLQSGNIISNDSVSAIKTGVFLQSAEDVENLVIGSKNNSLIYLKQIATVTETAETPNQFVQFGYGKEDTLQKKYAATYPAITLAISKKKGSDAMNIADELTEKVEHLKTNLITNDIHVSTTRNYGETASDKVAELLFHLFIAIIAVTIFVMLAMGWRGGLVVFLSVPVTFALTLLAYYLLGYTLNRITLFALVFITGIVVDDSIIIAENMHRHFKMKKLPFKQAAIFAINEVGNPTILATFTVIAAVLPMAFVSGLMGPYMSPMPIGASIAMMLSLIVALTLTPYLGYIFLREKDNANEKHSNASLEDSKVYKIYYKFINPLLETRWKRWAFIGSTAIILIASMFLFYTKSVAVKMLPFDNKNEFQVIIDMPEGTSLERTQAVALEIAAYVSSQPNIKNYQSYVGTAGPISFNGLVRHYDIRRGNNVADIQINLTDKKDRKLQSHDIVKLLRPGIQEIAKRNNANVKLVEIPPGPPVLSTLVAEIYGPDYEQQISIAKQVKDLFNKTNDVVDIDWYVEDNQKAYEFIINKDKAARYGIMPAQIVGNLHAALSGQKTGIVYQPNSFQQIPIHLQLPYSAQSSINDLKNLKVASQQGGMYSIGDLVSIQEKIKEKSIYRKNQKRVVYVTADMAGDLESPTYAITDISEKIKNIKVPAGYTVNEEYTQQPKNEDNYSLKWDGEWQITFEVFRDLGLAFAAVIIIIYMLIVGWFQNFVTPIIMLAAIPLSLIGILLGHWALGAYFTATSMIGFIALAGVMVRNSVLLIDFIDIRLREGIELKQAIIEAGAVRTTPILLTAGAVVLGAVIILFDPIFQGLAISLMGGTITSTFLTLIVVPLLYFKLIRKK